MYIVPILVDLKNNRVKDAQDYPDERNEQACQD